MKARGVKISLEGIDGSGKTTQLKLIEPELLRLGYRVYLAPDNSDASGKGIDGSILRILRKGRDRFFRLGYPTTESLLLAARASFLDERDTVPKLERGFVVICVRDIDTFVAYGLVSMVAKYPERDEKDLFQWLLSLVSVGRTQPDLTILFKPDLDTFLNRATVARGRGKRDRFSSKDKIFIRSVCRYYDWLAAVNTSRIRVLDVGGKSIQEVSQDVSALVVLFIRRYNVPTSE